MKRLERIQFEQARWQAKNFGTSKTQDQDCFLGMVEELGELAHARLKHKQKIRGVGRKEMQDAEKDALGDIVIYMLGYCNARHLNLESIVNEVWDQVSKRDWTKNKETGK